MTRNNPPLTYTRIALENPRTGGKHYRRRSGELVKETVGWIGEGRAFIDQATDLADFVSVLNTELRAGRDVLTYGVPLIDAEEGVVLTTKNDFQGGEQVTRSEDHFRWPDGAGIFAMDYDPREGHAVLSRDAFWDQLKAVVPGIADHDVAWGCSSSSYIYDAETGDMLVGLKGQRIYLAVEEAADIPRAADVLLKRFWLADHGYILVSGSGSQLMRATTDPCMYQASRIDYAAGAVCGRGLVQRRPDAFLISEGLSLVDTRALLPDLTAADEAEYLVLVEQAKADTHDDAMATRSVWADGRIEVEATQALGDGATPDRVRRKGAELRAAGRKAALMRVADADRPVLPISFVIHLSNGQAVSVGEILAHPGRYRNMTCRDPLEPDYRGGAVTGIIYPTTRRLVSQAHGSGRVFVLGKDAEYRDLYTAKAADFRHTLTIKRPTRMEESREDRIARMKEAKI
ncbi:hypothetical protein C1J05_11225 [Sulfitobacter sp. JL08]|uniref:hypothetical protein n=1 Tax=Sulfitobacter sp. JL08 TaxID=2070369 RepID=UPI000E0A2605|nr:hypothetical protein [Sulfitobacter sp. JL08]AXI54984.1 hypothetical protein C1J05_11225 [Sulfitobacter sp. JL08]